MTEVPFFSGEAMERISKAVRDIEDMKSGFPELVRNLLMDYSDDTVTINVIEVVEEMEVTPGHWLGYVHNLRKSQWIDIDPKDKWKVHLIDGTQIEKQILVIPMPAGVDLDTGNYLPGTLGLGMYVGILWGMSQPSGSEEEPPFPMEIYLAVASIGTGTGGGVAIRSTTTGPGPVTAYIQTTDPDDGGIMMDLPDSSPITVRKYPMPAREDFEINGRYPAVKVGNYWYAETGPKTACEEVVTKDSIAILNCDTLHITYTNTKVVRFVDRPCLPPAPPTS